MKKLLFKILRKFFDKQLQEEVENWYVEKQFKVYKIKDDEKVREKMADLWRMPEFKLWLMLQSNRKNYLGRRALTHRYKTPTEAAIKNAHLQGQAFNISLERAFIKRMNDLYKRNKSKQEDLK